MINFVQPARVWRSALRMASSLHFLFRQGGEQLLFGLFLKGDLRIGDQSQLQSTV